MPDNTPDKLTYGEVGQLIERLHKTGQSFRIKFYRSGALKRITLYEKKWLP